MIILKNLTMTKIGKGTSCFESQKTVKFQHIHSQMREECFVQTKPIRLVEVPEKS